MTELEAVKERHSVRSYQDKKIESDKIQKLNELINECNEKGNLNIQLVNDAGKTFNKLLNKFMGLGSAPSVIACIGKDDETLDERLGYYGQKIVLYAQTLGLNTCWAGTFSPKNVNAEIKNGERLAIVIAIGYGINNGRVRKSKSAEQVVRGGIAGKPDWFMKGVEAALLAPTAVNQQKFEIVLHEDKSVEIVDKGGVLSKIDKGIVKYNFETGAGISGKIR
ncbi:MAG: nitroreductase [Oscillospiraceae bacterium]|nr:nitroreductase [Oscillospiraceae bacterium]